MMTDDDCSDEHFVLVVHDHVPFVNPADYGLATTGPDAVEAINPADYFITSGDAVAKATVLEREMWAAAGAAQKRLGRSRQQAHQQFLAALWSAAGKCRALVNKLKKVRGNALWLETSWENHKLICVPKNPRPKRKLDQNDQMELAGD